MFANSNAACVFCTRFERIIHSISTDLAGHKHLFFFPCTMQGAHQSERRACVKVKTSCMRVKDLSRSAIERKRKKKEGGISTFTLLNYEMICGFAQVQVSFHH